MRMPVSHAPYRRRRRLEEEECSRLSILEEVEEEDEEGEEIRTSAAAAAVHPDTPLQRSISGPGGAPQRRGVDPDGHSYSSRSSLSNTMNKQPGPRHRGRTSRSDHSRRRKESGQVGNNRERTHSTERQRALSPKRPPSNHVNDLDQVTILAKLIWDREWEAAEGRLLNSSGHRATEAAQESLLPCFPLGLSTGLALHLACTMRPLPPASFVQTLIRVYPEACRIRQRTWGLLPLHLASDLSLHNHKTAGSKVPTRRSGSRNQNDSISPRLRLLLSKPQQPATEARDDVDDDVPLTDKNSIRRERRSNNSSFSFSTREKSSNDKNTPVSSSSEALNHARIVLLLVQFYPESIYAREDINGMLPLHIAASTARSENGVVSPTSASVLQVLIQSAPTTQTMEDGYGDTPVVLAWREAIFCCNYCGNNGSIPCLCQNRVAVAAHCLHPLLREEIQEVSSSHNRSIITSGAENSVRATTTTTTTFPKALSSNTSSPPATTPSSMRRNQHTHLMEEEESREGCPSPRIHGTSATKISTSRTNRQELLPPSPFAADLLKRVEHMRTVRGKGEREQELRCEENGDKGNESTPVPFTTSRNGTGTHLRRHDDSHKTKKVLYFQHSKSRAPPTPESPRPHIIVQQQHTIRSPIPKKFLQNPQTQTQQQQQQRRESYKTKKVLYSQHCETRHDESDDDQEQRDGADISPVPTATTTTTATTRVPQGGDEPSTLDDNEDPNPKMVGNTNTETTIAQVETKEWPPKRIDRVSLENQGGGTRVGQIKDDPTIPVPLSTGVNWNLLMCRRMRVDNDDPRTRLSQRATHLRSANHVEQQPRMTQRTAFSSQNLSLDVAVTRRSKREDGDSTTQPLLMPLASAAEEPTSNRGVALDFRTNNDADIVVSSSPTNLPRIPERVPRTPKTVAASPTSSTSVMSLLSPRNHNLLPTTNKIILRSNLESSKIQVLRIQLRLTELRRPASSKHPKRPPNPYYEIYVTNGHSVAARHQSYPLMATCDGTWDVALLDVTPRSRRGSRGQKGSFATNNKNSIAGGCTTGSSSMSVGGGGGGRIVSNKGSSSDADSASATTTTAADATSTPEMDNWQIGIRVLHYKQNGGFASSRNKHAAQGTAGDIKNGSASPSSGDAAAAALTNNKNSIIGECRTSLDKLQAEPQQPLVKGFQVMGWLEVLQLSLAY